MTIVVWNSGVFDSEHKRGHYATCPKCGWCSQYFTGEDSRLRAVTASHLHQQAKARKAEAEKTGAAA